MNICVTTIEKAEIFTGLFQHIKAFTEQVNIIFEKERMYIQTMDSSRVSIIEMDLHSSWFDRYEHTHNGTITIGINATILYKVLNSREKTQTIHIEYANIDSDKLMIHFTRENHVGFDKHFEIPLIELENELMGIPEINHQAEFTISSPHFSSIINQLQMFGDTVDIECNEDMIMLSSHSQDHGKMFVEIKIEELTTFIIDEGSLLNLSFSLQYLHNICLYNKLAKEIEIKISNEYPVQIIYDLGGHDEAPAKIKFYLAPKIQDE